MSICYYDWRKIYIFFIDYHYKFIECDKIEEGTLLNSPDPIDYHIEKCGKDAFKKLERSLIHTFWPVLGEDIEAGEDEIEEGEADVIIHEIENTDGSNEVV